MTVEESTKEFIRKWGPALDKWDAGLDPTMGASVEVQRLGRCLLDAIQARGLSVLTAPARRRKP